jgi:hypothetical protein
MAFITARYFSGFAYRSVAPQQRVAMGRRAYASTRTSAPSMTQHTVDSESVSPDRYDVTSRLGMLDSVMEHTREVTHHELGGVKLRCVRVCIFCSLMAHSLTSTLFINEHTYVFVCVCVCVRVCVCVCVVCVCACARVCV